MTALQDNARQHSAGVYGDDDEQTLSSSKDFLTVVLGPQRFGIPILQVQDVLKQQTMTRVPLAPPEIAGALNLRGRIVTAIDLRKRLGLPPREAGRSCMSVVVEYENELYSLIIDSVNDVMSLPDGDFETTPSTLDSTWRQLTLGIYRLKDELLVILDIPKLIGMIHGHDARDADA